MLIKHRLWGQQERFILGAKKNPSCSLVLVANAKYITAQEHWVWIRWKYFLIFFMFYLNHVLNLIFCFWAENCLARPCSCGRTWEDEGTPTRVDEILYFGLLNMFMFPSFSLTSPIRILFARRSSMTRNRKTFPFLFLFTLLFVALVISLRNYCVHYFFLI